MKSHQKAHPSSTVPVKNNAMVQEVGNTNPPTVPPLISPESARSDDRVLATLKQKLKEEEDTLKKKRASLGLADDANIEEEDEKLRKEIEELDMKIMATEMAKSGQDNSNGMQNETGKSKFVASDSRNTISVPSQNVLSDHLFSKWMIIAPKLNTALAKIGIAPICIGDIPLNTAEFLEALKRVEVVVQNADKIVEEQSEFSECELSEFDSFSSSDPKLEPETTTEEEERVEVVDQNADEIVEEESEFSECDLNLSDFESFSSSPATPKLGEITDEEEWTTRVP